MLTSAWDLHTADVTIDVFERCQQGKPLPDFAHYGAFEELLK